MLSVGGHMCILLYPRPCTIEERSQQATTVLGAGGKVKMNSTQAEHMRSY